MPLNDESPKPSSSALDSLADSTESESSRNSETVDLKRGSFRTPGARRWQGLQGLIKGDAKMLRREIEISLSALTPHDKKLLPQESFNRHLHLTLAKVLPVASENDFYIALGMSIKDMLMERWIKTHMKYAQEDPKRIYYMSMEFLLGRSLQNAVVNLELDDATKAAMHQLGLRMETIVECERDAGLGNGGLGRLAACFMDSMATLEMPAMGYGLRYEYGIFKQQLSEEGAQMEAPDDWLSDSNVWEVPRPDFKQRVKFYGHIATQDDGRRQWVDATIIEAIPYDIPVPGWHNGTINTIRLWSAQSDCNFHFEAFQAGNYINAVLERNQAESITRVLYPNDAMMKGKKLRLQQEYFLVSASLQDILERFKGYTCHICDVFTRKKVLRNDMSNFVDKVVLQLNDTHPSLAVPELMRLLMDEEKLGWDEAWAITTKVCNYTNHTLLSEALERWPTEMMEELLPRIMEIIYEINHRFLNGPVARKWPDNAELRRKLSIIEEKPTKNVNMAYLAIVGSSFVNGVAKIHSDILRHETFRYFAELWPGKFTCKTNGVTPRRWILVANPLLAEVLNSVLPDSWPQDLDLLQQLTKYENDAEFLHKLKSVKHKNKKRFAAWLFKTHGIHVNIRTIFDFQIKRIHEYKRQLLNLFHTVHLYLRLKRGEDVAARTVLIGGKAAPGYKRAKEIIQMINNVAKAINADPETKDKLQLVFLVNYDVSVAEVAIPSADLCQQISTAGKEASGTSNMKFMMNGALIMGTHDGANIEIESQVGEENIFSFGATVDELDKLRHGYQPRSVLSGSKDLQEVFEALRGGKLSSSENSQHVMNDILDSLLQHDEYFVLQDFESYRQAHVRAVAAFEDKQKWFNMTLRNIAQSGFFSSDRTIKQYNEEIWKAPTGMKVDF